MGKLCATRESRNFTGRYNVKWFKLHIGIVIGNLNYQVVVSRAPGCLRLFTF